MFATNLLFFFLITFKYGTCDRQCAVDRDLESKCSMYEHSVERPIPNFTTVGNLPDPTQGDIKVGPQQTYSVTVNSTDHHGTKDSVQVWVVVLSVGIPVLVAAVIFGMWFRRKRQGKGNSTRQSHQEVPLNTGDEDIDDASDNEEATANGAATANGGHGKKQRKKMPLNTGDEEAIDIEDSSDNEEATANGAATANGDHGKKQRRKMPLNTGDEEAIDIEDSSDNEEATANGAATANGNHGKKQRRKKKKGPNVYVTINVNNGELPKGETEVPNGASQMVQADIPVPAPTMKPLDLGGPQDGMNSKPSFEMSLLPPVPERQNNEM